MTRENIFNKNSIKEDFGKAASVYDDCAKLQTKIRGKSAVLAAQYFPPKGNILDLGCGTAAFSAEKEVLKAKWNVVGADISYGMCKEAQKKSVKIINADAALLPFKNESFDGVFSSLLLQWIENPEAVIKEILRVLTLDGIAIITTFTEGSLEELKQAFTVIDSSPHVSNFINASQLLLKIAHVGGFIYEAEEETYVENYDSAVSVMHSIKNIGARNKLETKRKGLMTPSQLKKLENAYKRENGKYPITWKVLTIIMGKA